VVTSGNSLYIYPLAEISKSDVYYTF
jgi:hypothetical protein